MIIVRDIKTLGGKYEWFDETNPKNYISRWCQTQENSQGDFTAEVLYLTAKTRQFVLVTPASDDKSPNVYSNTEQRYIQRNRSAKKLYPESALVWLVNRDFDIPKCLEHLMLAENEI